MSGSDNGSPGGGKPEDPRATEHLNIKVTDNNNEVFFKIKRTTQLKKLMDAFCERQGKAPTSVRFLFEGTRVGPTDSPETVSLILHLKFHLALVLQEGIINAIIQTLIQRLHSSRWQMATLLRFIKNRSVDPIEMIVTEYAGISWLAYEDEDTRRTVKRTNNHESYMSIWSWMVYGDRYYNGDKAFPAVANTV